VSGASVKGASYAPNATAKMAERLIDARAIFQPLQYLSDLPLRHQMVLGESLPSQKI
jgi:hypothetical protein